MTRVLIDGRALYDASRDRGIGTYLRNLLEALQGATGLEVSVLATPETALPGSAERVPVRRRFVWSRFGPFEHQLRLGREIGRARSDVFHSPALDPPRTIEGPWVQTVHDVLPLVFESVELAGPRRRWTRIGRRIATADAVIAVSRFTAESATNELGLDPGRVHVIPHGVPRDVLDAGELVPSDPPYILYVGEYGPWKGYREAFAAIALLAELGLPHRLRVAGRLTPWTEPAVRGLVEASAHPERIELLGLVDRAELVELYRDAEALVVTSRFEGFGLPALEAMAIGTPVVAFTNTAITEVVGAGGLLVPDGDVHALVDAVGELVTTETRRREVVQRGHARAAGFTWEESARRHAEVYAMVAGS